MEIGIQWPTTLQTISMNLRAITLLPMDHTAVEYNIMKATFQIVTNVKYLQENILHNFTNKSKIRTLVRKKLRNTVH